MNRNIDDELIKMELDLKSKSINKIEARDKIKQILKFYFDDIFEPDEVAIEKESLKLADLIMKIYLVLEEY